MIGSDVTFESCGVTLKGHLYEPSVGNSVAAVVVLLTGDSPNGSHSKTWRPLTESLRSAGLGVFIFDFLSQGDSCGRREDLSLKTGCSNFRDAMRALRDVLDLDRVKQGLLGSSFGAAVLLQVQEELSYQAMALKSPAVFLAESYETEHGFPEGMERWREAGVSNVTGLSYSAYLTAIQHNTYAAALSAKGPILIVHGTDDDIVPVVQSRRLAHLLGQRATLVELPGVKHDYKQPGAQDALQRAMTSFFTASLLGAQRGE